MPCPVDDRRHHASLYGSSGLGGNAFDERLELRVRSSAFPAGEVDRLPAPEFERQLDLVEEHRYEHVAFRCDAGFVSDPFGTDGMLGPENDDAPGGCELILNRLVKGLACDDLAIPPDR